MNPPSTRTLNLLLGISIALKIGISLWQLHRLYRLEQAEKQLAQQAGQDSLITVA